MKPKLRESKYQPVSQRGPAATEAGGNIFADFRTAEY
jgi:hypothetical protein